MICAAGVLVGLLAFPVVRVMLALLQRRRGDRIDVDSRERKQMWIAHDRR